ncbi:hypothetical protein [Mucilaginibacter xinganensis]|uniref:Uncharacterized protein n=1 Tax=Mucilaginibacter xinganensis TaxID=1234841 RepID=A0A223NX26_9SPHI|nr:hypothetical protein [Mucilaginibacter xinganensis]ASU34427.1 hypothetical protein MuYL_2540 [Mucilaginibacter xinganensis]
MDLTIDQQATQRELERLTAKYPDQTSPLLTSITIMMADVNEQEAESIKEILSKKDK